jgi:hypothetical protein
VRSIIVPTIRDDLEGVVYITRNHGATAPIMLRAGDVVPVGVTVGEHLVSGRVHMPEATSAAPLTGTPDDDAPVEPPRSGRGASKAAWAAYAATLGIESAPDASREDIIAAVDEALGR